MIRTILSATKHGRPFRGLPVLFLTLLLASTAVFGQADSLKQIQQSAENAELATGAGDNVAIAIQNVDISKFPLITLICELVPGSGIRLDTLRANQLLVKENGVEKRVVEIKKISQEQQVPVDFIFLVDVTGTMQGYINDIKSNVKKFTTTLQQRGIDYKLGLITYTDVVETLNQPTTNVGEFLNWLELLKASGGLDEKENALEALAELKHISFRPAANRVAVLVTDAPYHQSGERGSGVTSHTTKTITRFLNRLNLKTFCIVRPELDEYRNLTKGTKGSLYNINHPFSQILDLYSTQITNLYAVTYKSDAALSKDSIKVSILDEQRKELVNQKIPIVEIGRKFIIENLLYKTGSSALPDSVSELDVLVDFMEQRPSVRIRIEGHTDDVGSRKTNMLLSTERAESVKQYLVDRKVDKSRVTTEGLGPDKPLGSNTTNFGRRLNRRTEIIITNK